MIFGLKIASKADNLDKMQQKSSILKGLHSLIPTPVEKRTRRESVLPSIPHFNQCENLKESSKNLSIGQSLRNNQNSSRFSPRHAIPENTKSIDSKEVTSSFNNMAYTKIHDVLNTLL